jgi:hypothetical protein
MSNQSDPLDKRNLIEVDASTLGKYAGLFTPASLYNKLVRYVRVLGDNTSVKRARFEINAQNIHQYKNAQNPGWGFMAFPEVTGKFIDILDRPVLTRNDVPIALEGDIYINTLTVYHGYGPQGFGTWFFPVEGSQSYYATKLEDFRAEGGEQKFIKGGFLASETEGYVDPNDEGKAGAVFIWLDYEFAQGAVINPDFKAWVEFYYFDRE